MKKAVITQKSETDWERIASLKDSEIDFTDLPEATPEMFARAVVRRGLKPITPGRQVSLEELVSRMPADYEPREEDFGRPVGREEL